MVKYAASMDADTHALIQVRSNSYFLFVAVYELSY